MWLHVRRSAVIRKEKDMRKYSQEWHNDSCERSLERMSQNGHKKFFCKTHNQWASEVPVKSEVTHTYGDGTILVVKLK